MLTLTSSDISRTMSYDRVGRLKTVTEAANPQANVSLTYNALGALTSEISCGLPHSYFYDIVGSRIHAAYGSGRTVSTEYDSLNRPLVITEGQRTTSYGYDLAGRAVKLQTANGNLCWNVYDVLGRLKKRTLYADVSAQTKLTDLDYDYDALGNVMSQLENWPGSSLRPLGWRVTTMTYDDSNRLETETVSQSADPDSLPGSQLIRTVYSYDAANNRQTKTVLGGDEPGFWDYNYNNANQLRTWQKYDDQGGTLLKNALLFYDDDGNRRSQELSVPGATKKITSYQWDAQNRLMGVTMPDSSQHNYVYDYRTRRIGTRSEGILPSGGGAATSKTTSIVFAGGLSLAEWEQSGSTAPPILNTPPTVEYTRGPDMGGGVGGLLYSLRGSTPKFNLSNGRGDIIAQSDAGGELTWTASYEAYGKRTKETGANQDKQRANSKDEDPTGLLNEGFRYRDIETGVWLSRDPAGFVDGPNLYAYVKQNPWSYFDPKGLEKVTVSGQPGDHKNRRHFLVNGLDRAKKMADQVKKDKSKEQVTWLVYNDGGKGGYSSKDLKEFGDKATKAGVEMKIVSSAKDIVNYINDKGGESNPRSSDKVTSFSYLGHAAPGNFLAGFVDHGTLNMWFCDRFSPHQLKPSAFASGCDVNLVGGCRTGVSGFLQSTSSQFETILDPKSKIKSSSVRVNYGNESVDTDQDLVAPGKNKGPKDEHGHVIETNGRYGLPTDHTEMPVGYF